MLNNFKNIASSILFKILIATIILSFIIWGIGDVIRGFSSDKVISIDNKYFISHLDFKRAKRNYLLNLENLLNRQLTLEEISNRDINNNIINYLLEIKLFELLKDELKLNVSDEVMLKYIRSNDNFYNKDKHFDTGLFSKILSSNMLSEGQFIDIIKNEKAKEFIIDTLNMANLYPNKLAEISAKYLGEKRSITLAYITPKDMNLYSPTKQGLEDIYQANRMNFTVPELRALSYIEISPETVKANVKISDSEIKEEYKNYLAENYTVEKRNIYNLIISDKSKAEEVLELLKAGHDFNKLAEKYSHRSLDKILVKSVVKSDLPAELQDIAFSLKLNEFSKIIATNVGYHILKVADIQKVAYPNYDIMKLELYNNLLNKKAEELVYDYTKNIEQFLSSPEKQDIKLLAQDLNLPLKITPHITSMGTNLSGHKIILPDIDEIVNIIFTQKPDEIELHEDVNNNLKFYVITLNDIQAQKQKNFDEAKSLVLKIWQQNIENQKITEIQKLLSEKIQNENKSLVEEAHKLGLLLELNQIVYRNLNLNSDFVHSLPPQLIGEILSLPAKALTNIYKQDDNYIIAQIEATQLDNSHYQNNLQQVNKSLTQQYKSGFIIDLLNYLKSYHAVKINTNIIQ